MAAAENAEKAVDLDDWREVQATLDGDDEAYARLVDRYQNAVASLMWRFTRSREAHEELVQRAFVEAYFSLEGFRGEGSFIAWLRTIGTRVGYRWWRQRDRYCGSDRRPLDIAIERVSQQEEYAVGPEEAAELIHRLLECLDAPERLVLTLFYLEESSMREIGRHLDCSEDAAKMRVHRAREKLRRIVEKENLEEELGWNT
jgi:RNA polymerase sigma-70 factor (ECF subfamily)